MIYVAIFVLLFCGSFAIVSELLGHPPASTGKGIRTAVKKETSAMRLLNAYCIAPFVKVIAPFIRIADFKEKRMGIQLARAGIELTPKEYYARSVLMAGASFLLSFTLLSCTVKHMSFVSVILGVVVFFSLSW